MYVCPSGHMATKKKKASRPNSNDSIAYYFDITKCKVCALQNGCYKKDAKTKSYTITIKSSEHTKQLEFQETDSFKEKAKQRYKVEAKNGELKNSHGYDRARAYGIINMKMQAAITIFAVNLKRILKLA